VMKQRPPRQEAIILPWHTLAMMSHGNEGN
jgi:hypothetical protein